MSTGVVDPANERRHERKSLSMALARGLVDTSPTSSLEAWSRTTAGALALLLFLQMLTGLLLAFYYVPSTESAYTTVSYIEKIVSPGAWIRSIHHYVSQWVTLVVVLHIWQLLWRKSYVRRPLGFVISVLLLTLILFEGASGYSLPWDIRAYFATRITENLTGGLPVVGDNIRQWVLGGSRISPGTLARFFAMHAILLPGAILIAAFIRLLVSAIRSGPNVEDNTEVESQFIRRQLTRNAITFAVVFVLVAIFTLLHRAPFGPSADLAEPGYLPRPGPQFLWLFELLKFLPGNIASIVGTTFPGLVILLLITLPWTWKRLGVDSQKKGADVPWIGYTVVLVIVAAFTIGAYVEDYRNVSVREQLARQAAEEREFMAQPFEPKVIVPPRLAAELAAASPSPGTAAPSAKGDPPQSYVANCSQCHGFRGEGTALFPKLLGVSAKPRRTPDDLVKLLDDPTAYGLKPPMRSFADKLTDQQKHEITDWLSTLKK